MYKNYRKNVICTLCLSNGIIVCFGAENEDMARLSTGKCAILLRLLLILATVTHFRMVENGAIEE